MLEQTLKGQAMTRTDPFGSADIIRGSAPIFSGPDSDNVVGAVVVDYFLPKSLAKPAANISRTAEDYFQLRILKQPILNSYILALVLIGLVVVLLASWFGMYLARGITGPISELAAGTHAIAGGNLDYTIDPVGDDEIGQLVDSFNQMTTDLRVSQAELERRRRYTETLLKNVSAGVVGLNPEGRLTAINPHAERLLGVRVDDVIGRNYREVLRPPLLHAIDEVLSAFPARRENRSSIKIEIDDAEVELMITASPLSDDAGTNLGSVLFFEDVSQIAKVERMEAWREVARRIAHEIKNPLTPIQLSAERLRRQLGPRLARLGGDMAPNDGRVAGGMHPHHHRRGRGPQAPGERIFRLRAHAASEPRAGRPQRACDRRGREFPDCARGRGVRAGAGARAAAHPDRSRVAQARADQPARQRGLRDRRSGAQWPWTAHRAAHRAESIERSGGPRGSRQRSGHQSGAADADFRTVLLDQARRHRAGSGDSFCYRDRSSWLRAGGR